jgi:hypothetical protein
MKLFQLVVEELLRRRCIANKLYEVLQQQYADMSNVKQQCLNLLSSEG